MTMMVFETQGVPETCMAGTFHSHGWIALLVTIAGLAGAAYSLAKGFAWMREPIVARRAGAQPPDRHTAKAWLLGVWLLVPPAWLFVEDIFLFRHFGKVECFDQFRYAQELVARGWVVLVVALGFLYFGREIAGKE
ncbi:MAG: hypothetical protein JSS95_10175 [Acidobacteria bacterium]|nr:hypothetical protein [Acidobacteriota bacterium]